MTRVFTTIFVALFLLTGAVAASAACPYGSVSVLTYGAVPNDGNADGKPFQNAINGVSAGGVLCVPSGVYLIDRQLNVRRDDLTITGEGISSVLKLITGNNVTILKIGEDEVSPQVTSHGITVEKLAFDGNVNTGTTSTGQNFFGLWVERGEDIILRDLYFEEFLNEGITVANGEVPNLNVLIERVRTEKIGRNALHVGFAEDIVIRNCILDSNQDEATWGVVAGNAIDVEVEGYFPSTMEGGWVKRLTIEDTFMRAGNLNAAGTSIALQPAYGPIDDVTVQRNLGLEKGIGSFGSTQYSAAGTLLHNTNIRFNQNWIAAYYTQAAFGGMLFQWTDYGEANDNVITNYFDGNSNMVRLNGAKFIDGYNNSFYRPYYTNLYSQAFMVDSPYWNNVRVRFYNTADNGWADSRIVHYANGVWTSAGVIGVTSSTVTWNINSNSIPTNNPSITSAQISSGNLVVQTSEPNSLPVRVVALRNGLPIGMKAASSGSTTFVLPEPAVSGDVFAVRAYNQHGREATYSFTY